MFLLIWRYTVRPDDREAFIDAYGQSGIWARFFAKGKGFIRTELFQDPADGASFMTLDFWTSRGAFSDFQKEHISGYREIDVYCEGLTETETFVGAFNLAGSDPGAFYPGYGSLPGSTE